MHIPDRYYKRIPKFYFIVGLLLVLTSFNMHGNRLGAILYFVAGVVSVIYAISVHQARKKRRKLYSPPPGDLRPVPDDDSQPADGQQRPNVQSQFVNDNTAIAEEQEQVAAGNTKATDNEQLHFDKLRTTIGTPG